VCVCVLWVMGCWWLQLGAAMALTTPVTTSTTVSVNPHPPTTKATHKRTRTPQLKDEVDEAMFEYYGSSELVTVDVVSGATRALAPPRLYTEVDARWVGVGVGLGLGLGLGLGWWMVVVVEVVVVVRPCSTPSISSTS